MSGNNSSINPQICVQGAAGVGSRISVRIEQTSHGLSKGMAVRFNSGVDGEAVKYVAAKNTNAYEAEVVGIVSEVLTADAFELTTSGILDITSFFGSVIGSGMTADDVYFLGSTAGHLTTIRPTTPGHVAKPVITRLAQDTGTPPRIYGSVTNYVGSLLGGNAAASLGEVVPAGVIQPYLGKSTSVPAGWAFCDGVGLTDSNGIPGFDVTTYSSYYNAVGLRYGFVEKVTLTGSGFSIGDRIRQTHSSGRNIEGLVRAKSGNTYYVEQSLQANDLNYNDNFITAFEIDNETRGDDEVSARYDSFDSVIRNFSTGSCTILRTNGSTSSDTISNPSIYSILPPDLRGRFLYGESNENILGRQGGISSFTINNNTTGGGGGYHPDGSFISQLSIPPYVTTNYIVRIGDSASASILDDISLKNLKITNLPTSDPSVAGALFNDSGTLKISSG
tara:strand:+ start:328 stop:1671 length:1344 start_codon:yes stop_codon:yes gene_type:complete